MRSRGWAPPSITRKRIAPTAAALVLTLGVHGGATSAAPTPSEHAFEGSCATVGVAVVDQPVAMVPGPNSVTFTSTGRCTGLLDGVALPQGGVPARYALEGDKVVGCAGGVVHPLAATLTLRPRGAGPVSFDGSGAIAFAGPLQGGLLEGDHGGSAVGEATILAGREAFDLCLAGELRSNAIGVVFTTATALVSN
jgi:hypothetical protein